MRKYVKTLTAVDVPSTTHTCNDKTVGNHQARVFDNIYTFTVADDRDGDNSHRDFKGNKIFLYHGHTICVVNDREKSFVVSHAHHTGSVNTKQAVNQYRRYFMNEGYEDMTYVED